MTDAVEKLNPALTKEGETKKEFDIAQEAHDLASEQVEFIIKDPKEVDEAVKMIAEALEVPEEVVASTVYEDQQANTESDFIRISKKALITWVFFLNLVILTVGIAAVGGYSIATATECSMAVVRQAIFVGGFSGLAASVLGAYGLNYVLKNRETEGSSNGDLVNDEQSTSDE